MKTWNSQHKNGISEGGAMLRNHYAHVMTNTILQDKAASSKEKSYFIKGMIITTQSSFLEDCYFQILSSTMINGFIEAISILDVTYNDTIHFQTFTQIEDFSTLVDRSNVVLIFKCFTNDGLNYLYDQYDYRQLCVERQLE